MTIHGERPPIRLGRDGVLRVGQFRAALDDVVRAYKVGANTERVACSSDALDPAETPPGTSSAFRAAGCQG